VFATPAATVARDGAGHVTVRATRVTEPITLDGTLDEDLYARIQPIDGFLQQEPHEGQPATQKTDVWLLYDDKYVYVAARCWMTNPESIVANEMRRDSFAIFQNDNFGVLFDTFHDRRNGFLFYTNPLGGLGDSLITDERDTNRDWNTVWDARTKRFERGWTVEIAIPMADVNGLDKEGAKVPPALGDKWRLNLFRMDAGKDPKAQVALGWSPPMVGDFHKLDRFGELVFVDDKGEVPAAKEAAAEPAKKADGKADKKAEKAEKAEKKTAKKAE